MFIFNFNSTIRREQEEIEQIKKTEQRSSKAATYDRYMDHDEVFYGG